MAGELGRHRSVQDPGSIAKKEFGGGGDVQLSQVSKRGTENCPEGLARWRSQQ